MDTGEDSKADGRWMTYRELASARRIDPPSAVKLAVRNGWRKQKDNHGVVRVLVPLDQTARKDLSIDMSADKAVDKSMDMARLVRGFEAALTALRERADAESLALREQLDRELARADQAEAKLGAVEALLATERNRAEKAEALIATERERAEVALQVRAIEIEAATRRAAAAAAEVEAMRQRNQARNALGIVKRLRAAWRGE